MSFVMNNWYVACLASEVGQSPLARTLLGVPVVMFQTESGEVHALRDICPHRAAPLHRGEVVGDRIRCAYHGLEFDGHGTCRHNPHVSTPPEHIQGRAYPLAQKYGMYWIWLGEPALADEGQLPEFPYFGEASPVSIGRGYTTVAADYRLMIDNLFDLTHAEYIHPESVGIPGAHHAAEHKLERGDTWVKIHFNVRDMPPAAVWRSAWNKSEHMDQHAYMLWTGGGTCYLDLCITPPGAPRSEGWNLPFLHLLTPETERSTYYFWAHTRDFDIENAELTESVNMVSKKAFDQEDRPIIESAQRSIEEHDARLRNFTVGDSASKLIRQMIKRTVDQEKAPVADVDGTATNALADEVHLG